jgi:hypothetical protein
MAGPASSAAADPLDCAEFHAGIDGSNNLSDILDYNGLLAAKTGDTGSYSYTGNKISLRRYAPNDYGYNVSTYLTIAGIGSYLGHGCQALAVHGDTAFIFYDTGYCRTVDLVAKTLISSFQLPSGVAGANNNCGQANFGSEYHSVGDDFPVLYLSSYKEDACYVLAMTTSSASLVQTIRLSADGTTAMDSGSFFVDNENDKMIVKMPATDVNGKAYNYFKVFDLPALDLGASVLLLDEKKCDEFYVRVLKGNVAAASNVWGGGFAMNGKLYVCAGSSGSTSSLLVVDYEKHKILSEVRWGSSLITSRTQQHCAKYNDMLLLDLTGADYLPAVEFV